MLQEFNETNEAYLALVVSIWEFGEAIGPLFTGPLSEVFGRAPIYHVSNLLFLGFSIASALSPSIQCLVAFRFLNGICVMALALTPSVIGDMFPQEQRGGALTWAMTPGILGGMASPIIGSYVNEALGWRWIFWLTAILAAVIEVGFICLFRETYRPVIQQRRRLLARATQPRSRLSGFSIRAISKALLRPVKIFLVYPAVSLLYVFAALVYADAYIIMTTITPIFEAMYNISEGAVGLMFLGRGRSIFFNSLTIH